MNGVFRENQKKPKESAKKKKNSPHTDHIDAAAELQALCPFVVGYGVKNKTSKPKKKAPGCDRQSLSLSLLFLRNRAWSDLPPKRPPDGPLDKKSNEESQKKIKTCI